MLLTVLMPVFDSGKYLEKSVSSILNQTFSDFEFLIINDGSTDDSLDILSKFSDRRIRIESNDCNRGLIYTLNRGVELAQGQYIARMDSDDIAHPKRLELQMNFLLKHLDVVMCGASHIGFNGVSKRKQYFPLDYEDIKAEAEQAENILKSIDTNYAKDKARDEEIASLKDKVSGVESKLDKILDIVSNTNKLN